MEQTEIDELRRLHEADSAKIINAMANIDWQQHLMNAGGCFHVEDDGRLCGRADRWAGHSEPGFHMFVPLYVAATKLAKGNALPALLDAAEERDRLKAKLAALVEATAEVHEKLRINADGKATVTVGKAIALRRELGEALAAAKVPPDLDQLTR